MRSSLLAAGTAFWQSGVPVQVMQPSVVLPAGLAVLAAAVLDELPYNVCPVVFGTAYRLADAIFAAGRGVACRSGGAGGSGSGGAAIRRVPAGAAATAMQFGAAPGDAALWPH